VKGLDAIVDDVRRHPEFHRAGMLLCHIGVVRGHTRDGRAVKSLNVQVDHERLEQVLTHQRARPGILDVRAAIVEGRELKVGEEIMVLVVAGDIRENVLAVMADTLDLIKTSVTEKTHTFRDET
jgi:molybdopterin synthase catalytic subunit